MPYVKWCLAKDYVLRFLKGSQENGEIGENVMCSLKPYTGWKAEPKLNPQLLNPHPTQTHKSQLEPKPKLKMILNLCPAQKTITHTQPTRMESEHEIYKIPVIKLLYWKTNWTYSIKHNIY